MDESPEVHDARELDRLVRFMTREGRRFGLALATYADAGVAAELRESAAQRASAAATRVSVLGLSDGDLIERLATASDSCDVIFVVGLDPLVYDRDGSSPETLSLRSLNLRRDELPGRVNARMIFWIAAEAYPQVARLAWDLLDVMFTRFDFRSQRSGTGSVWRKWSALPMVLPWPLMRQLDEAEVDAWTRIASDPNAQDVTRADAALSLGYLYAEANRPDIAIEWLERAAAGFERLALEDNNSLGRIVLAHAHRRLAELWWRERDLTRARDEIEYAIELIESTKPELLVRPSFERERLGCLWVRSQIQSFEGTLRAHQFALDDFQLLERWRNGDSEAIRSLFDRQLPALSRFFQLVVRERVNEDLIVETFMRLWRLPQKRPTTDFRAALFKVAKAVARDEPATAAWPETVGPRNPDLQASLEQLPPEAQELIEMHYVFGVPTSNLAEMFGVVEPTLQYRLNAAVDQLLDLHAQRTGVRLSEPALRAAFGSRSATEPRP